MEPPNQRLKLASAEGEPLRLTCFGSGEPAGASTVPASLGDTWGRTGWSPQTLRSSVAVTIVRSRRSRKGIPPLCFAQ